MAKQRCYIRGCRGDWAAGQIWDGVYVGICHGHFREMLKGKPRPLMKRYALERVLLRNRETRMMPSDADQVLAAKFEVWRASKEAN